MTRLDILKNCHDMACHNLLCYSASYSMEKPKQGCEKDWNDSAEECRILEEWICELVQVESDCSRISDNDLNNHIKTQREQLKNLGERQAEA